MRPLSIRPGATSIGKLIRHELMLLRRLAHDRRLASSRLEPVIRSGPQAQRREVRGRSDIVRN